jgi:hypothetical protein
MKKSLLIFLLLALSLTLAACGGNAASTTGTSTSTQLDQNARELPLSTKLAIGILKLEGTEFAVASNQAADLLPLWQVLNTLSASDSAAPDEIAAVTQQIQETMTSEQLTAIDKMGLTGEDSFAIMQELGLVDAPQVNASGTPQAGGGFGGGQGSGGGFPGGVPGSGPGGDGGPGGGLGGQEISPEQMATAQARRAENGGGSSNRMLTLLVQAVIDLLESKAQ